MGELSLDGGLQPERGNLHIAIQAKKEGVKGIILPKQDAREAAIVDQLTVLAADNMKEIIDFFNETHEITPTTFDCREEFYARQSATDLDFSEVKGQENIKRAMEIA